MEASRSDDQAAVDQQKFYENDGTIIAGLEPVIARRARKETLMQRIVSTAKAVAASSTVQALAKMPASVARRVMAAGTAFIDAIESYAAKY